MNDYSSPLKTKYTDKFKDRARIELLQLITEKPQRVLEIGCGAGATGYALKQKFKDIEYIGIESEEEAAQIARTRLDKVIVSDIEKAPLETFGLLKEHFDLIICADVLEHLYDPWKTLFVLHEYLKPDGKLLTSIPNIQNISIITNLLKGYWTYEAEGLLAATHIRFFTLNEVAKMLSGSGYRIIHCSGTTNQPNPEGEEWPRDMDYGKIILKNISKEEASRLHVFQYLIIAQKVVS